MLTNRPVLIHGDSEVAVRPALDGSHEEIFVTWDGQAGLPLEADDVVRIRRADRALRLVRASTRHYFDVLRQKLKWGER
jgi:NAD+ kinase